MIIWLWIGFIVLVLLLLAFDLGVLGRKAHVIGLRESLVWSGFWTVLGVVFAVAVYYLYQYNYLGISHRFGHPQTGSQAALQYFTGYLIERSLSLDNIFVFALIFAYFQVPAIYQRRTLYWGVLGALVLRGLMIAAGAALIARFYWVGYVFGALLIATAIRMLVVRQDNIHPERNPLVRFARRFYPVTPTFQGQRFFTRIDGRRAITPMFLVLLVVESSDVLFAIDSIPAIFAVTQDPFLVFTSNIFAILGLRALYFALAGLMHKFRYMKGSLVFILAYVGVKMLLAHHYPIPTLVSLAVICAALAVGVLASVFRVRWERWPLASLRGNELADLAHVSLKQAKRIVILVVGITVLLVGVAMIALPGPAFLVIPAGLAILATEFVWAARLLRRIKQRARAAITHVRKAVRSGDPPDPPG